MRITTRHIACDVEIVTLPAAQQGTAPRAEVMLNLKTGSKYECSMLLSGALEMLSILAFHGPGMAQAYMLEHGR